MIASSLREVVAVHRIEVLELNAPGPVTRATAETGGAEIRAAPEREAG